MTSGPTRRTVLTAPLAASVAARIVASLRAVPFAAPLLGVAGCEAPAIATPDAAARGVAILRETIAAKQEMIAMYSAVRAAHPGLAWRLDPLIGDNIAHLAELKRRLIEPARRAGNRANSQQEAPARQRGQNPGQPTARYSGQPAARATERPGTRPGSPPLVPHRRGAALAALRSAERMAAMVHAGQLREVPPSLAQLLASIAACEATHAVALSKHGLAP